MNQLRRLADHLDRWQDEQDKMLGRHEPILLTASILSAKIRQLEEEDRNFCQQRKK